MNRVGFSKEHFGRASAPVHALPNIRGALSIREIPVLTSLKPERKIPGDRYNLDPRIQIESDTWSRLEGRRQNANGSVDAVVNVLRGGCTPGLAEGKWGVPFSAKIRLVKIALEIRSVSQSREGQRMSVHFTRLAGIRSWVGGTENAGVVVVKLQNVLLLSYAQCVSKDLTLSLARFVQTPQKPEGAEGGLTEGRSMAVGSSLLASPNAIKDNLRSSEWRRARRQDRGTGATGWMQAAGAAGAARRIELELNGSSATGRPVVSAAFPVGIFIFCPSRFFQTIVF